MLIATSSNPEPVSPAASVGIASLFDTLTPYLTLSPQPSAMDEEEAPQQPNFNEALPQAMADLAQAMTALMAQLQNAPAAQGPAYAPAPVHPHQARIKCYGFTIFCCEYNYLANSSSGLSTESDNN